MDLVTSYYYQPASNIHAEIKLDKELGLDNDNYLIRNFLHINSSIQINNGFSPSNKSLISYIDNLFFFGKKDADFSASHEIHNGLSLKRYGYSSTRAFQKNHYLFKNGYENKFNEKALDNAQKNINNSKFFSERRFSLKKKEGIPLTIIELEKVLNFTDNYWTLF